MYKRLFFVLTLTTAMLLSLGLSLTYADSGVDTPTPTDLPPTAPGAQEEGDTVTPADGNVVRVATFNASLNRSNAGDLIDDTATMTNTQLMSVAKIIQLVAPDVLLINEFDYDANGTAIAQFKANYLEVSQDGATPITYPYVYNAPSNTGIASGVDFDNSGSIGGPGDAYGFGFFPGQFGMVLLSKYPILTDQVRTFQNFLWADMPNSLLPTDFYTATDQAVFRLSSKSHWDVPINVNGSNVHILASHPTPPVFDGPEDRNGTRNHDEIRFWSDYVTPGAGDYIYDDVEGSSNPSGGLPSGAAFVIMGDQNADPNDGDSTNNAILQLTQNSQVNTSVTPSSLGGPEDATNDGNNNDTHVSDPAFDTADFGDTGSSPGNLRVDYVLPSNELEIMDAGVFWPLLTDTNASLVTASDHRLVWVDVETQEAVALSLLHNNDGESGLLPSSGDISVGGAAAFKTVADREIADAQNNGNAAVMVYAGDAFLASATIQCSFPITDTTQPVYDAIAQRQMPYDAHILGNHEFDYGPDFLARFIRAFEVDGTLDQPFLSANLDFSAESGFDDLVDADGLIDGTPQDGRVVARSLIVTDSTTGAQFGIIGATTTGLASVSSPRNVTVQNLTDTVTTIQTEIDTLGARGVNKIIFVSHLQSKDNDIALIEQLQGIDLAVGGGGDDFLVNSNVAENLQLLPGQSSDDIEGEYPLTVTDAASRTVYLVTSIDRYQFLGRLDVQFDANGEVTQLITDTSYPRRVIITSTAATDGGYIDAVTPDANIVTTVNTPVEACLAELAADVLANTEVPLDVSRNGVRGRETNAGNLIADSFLDSYDRYRTNVNLDARSLSNPVVAVQNGGGIRQNAGDVLPRDTGIVPGPISRLDAIDVLPFDNRISVVPDVTPQELIDLLFDDRSTSGIYQVSGLKLLYEVDNSGDSPRYNIVDITLVNVDGSETPLVQNGSPVAGAPNVTIVTNSFVAGRELASKPNQVALTDANGTALFYEQPLREYLASLPQINGTPTITRDNRAYEPGGEGRIIIPGANGDISVGPTGSGSLSGTSSDGVRADITIPTGAVSDTTVLRFTVMPYASLELTGTLQSAGIAFTLDAFQNGNIVENFNFATGITITLTYTDSNVADFDEESLHLYIRSGDSWIDAATTCTPTSTYVRDTVNNTLSVQICHLTEFAAAGGDGTALYLPVILQNP